MVVAVTGADGFVGRHLCHYLSKHGMPVRELSRRDYGDLSNKIDWRPRLIGAEHVIHTAGLAHVGNEKSVEMNTLYRRINAEATAELATQAAALGIRKFIFISSAQVHGRSSEKPVSEDSPYQETSPYNISKIAAEKALSQIAETTGMEIIILRPPVMIGNQVKGNLRTLIEAVQSGWPLPFGKLNAPRSVLSVDNLADAIHTIIHHNGVARGTYLLADEGTTSIQLLTRLIGEGLGKKVTLLPVPAGAVEWGLTLIGKHGMVKPLCEPMQLITNRFNRHFGYKPTESTADGVRKMCKGERTS